MKRLRGLLCVLLALCLLPVQAGAAGCSAAGSCGEDLTWSVADGVLTIRGTGEMDDYYYAYEGGPDVPGWDPYSFTKIVVEEGVTSIGAYAFSYAGDSPVTSVRLPGTLDKIGEGAFYGCGRLTSVRLPEGLTYIGGSAFSGCTALAEINIPDSVTTLGTWFLEDTAVSAPSSWARADIEEAAGLGLIPTECSYGYQRDVTREQIAALAVYMVDRAGGNLNAEAPDPAFTDVDKDNWEVAQAAALGIVDGVGGGRFDPKGRATREQIAAILCRAAACLEEALDRTLLDRTAKLPDSYTDRNQVSAWAVDDLAALVGSGIMGGTSAATLSPQANTTIEEAVVLMLRLFKRSFDTPAKNPAGERFRMDRAEVLSADYEIAQGIMAPDLGRAEVPEEQLDELIAAYNRSCLTSARYDPDMGDTVQSFSCWLTLHMADGSDFSLCHRGTGEVRVWGEGEGNMILRSLELYELLDEIVSSSK